MTTTTARYGFIAAAAAAVLTFTTLHPRAQDAPAQPDPSAAPAGRGGGRGGAGQGGGRGTVPGGAPQPGGRGPSIGSQGGQMAADPANANMDYSPKPPIVALSPEEEKKHFILPPGYTVDLVLEDKDVISPAAMVFDADGRMYIAEMRTFMRDADATGQLDPISRVSMHESTKHDGVYDKHTVFADHLVMPRMVLPLDKGGILVNETHSDDLVLFTDTNGDGIADKRQVFFTGIGSNRDGNVQHEQSGLIWGLDNWIYSTYNAFRIRWTPTGVVREPSGSSGAEWGQSMDDDGRMWFVNSGGERGPVAFQVPIQYGAFNTADQFEPGFEIVYPAPGIGDMQGGAPRVRMPFDNLNHMTASSAPEIVRTDRYPDMNGDLLFCDFVGRLIRRAKVTKSEGLTQLKNVYPGAEFMVSTDPLFRPVNIKTGPDGALYILDWYQGIMQDANWTGRGTYLRTKIEQYGLDKVTNHGRVWRLRFTGIPGTAPASAPARPGVPAIELSKTWPQMTAETGAQLVAHLDNPIGWWRDTAQRLIVLRQDKSVVPALQQMARSSSNVNARIHALWTLEGLGALDPALVREQIKDANPRIRVQAIRASETLYKAGNRSFDADYRALAKDADADVAIQALLTLNVLKASDIADVVKSAQAANPARGVKEIGNLMIAPPAGRGGGRGGPMLSPEQQQLIDQGGAVFKELCFTCHGDDGRGRPLAGTEGAMMAPPLAGSPRVNGHRDYVIKTLLKGLTGPIGDAKYSEVMVPMGTNTDQWIASVASYVRTSFGNVGGFVTPADVARVRAASASRKTPWTVPELEASLPHRLDADQSWKATASHNTGSASAAFTNTAWTTGAPQAPGMWFQIELPQPAMLTEVEFDSPAVGGRGGGAGARGGTGAPPPPPVVQYPRGYKVELSLDGVKWGAKPAAEGKGSGTHTTVTFAPTRAKFLRITQTDAVDAAPVWAMSNVRVYEAVK